ncbi:asparagine synthase (glutamine-hydrolyzing) [Falsibacillus pallidus]|uniref:asparagine synthase (glutamine-hydrolyzing) n=1 Tax=Falsibacillus pallidus TaxID=493781 RepID=A0A370GVX1_9BACI|nr:asparagine synthase (glutamine-hydrolyzing) [Falsibacillus pallidus]RDI47807.1 asparagine synthase (glutamine-hydrolysing) [Falsibacillus pallidus]
MCGITGWIHFHHNLNNELDVIKKMTDTLSKRGPDDVNIWSNQHAALGHKRLVVVDPAGGRQPMSRKRGEHVFTLCYNGELYNTEDLRKELLSKGYSFQGHSDTEVLLNAYIEWRENCVDFLNGIFAFAVWDSQKEQLFIGRDRLGVKPLFYAEINRGFIFGSEMKTVLAHKDMKPEIDRTGLSEVLGLGPSRSPGNGVFKNLNELRPGHALTFSRDGLKIWRYWNVKSERHRDTFDETVENVGFLLNDAVTRQLVSDVPLCTFLSGGLDSSAITAIAANQFKREGKGALHTYSIDYEGNDQFFKADAFQPNSDGPWIEQMVNTFGTKHHYSVISQEELVENLEEAVLVRDLPGMADVDSSLLWFCKEIKQDFVVSLSGECADEIFGGYPWFHREDDLNRKGFPWMRSTEERQGLLNDSWKSKLKLDEYVQAVYQNTVDETPCLEGESPLEARRRELFYLNMVWFMTTLLDRKDRMSMGASLEVRVPFADHRLVEYAWNIPWDWKMADGREKGLLRKSLEGVLPHDILYRKKSPYPKTHHPVYTKLVKDKLTQILNNRSSVLLELFDSRKLQAIVDSGGDAFRVPWYGQLMKGPQLLAYLIQVDYWFEKNNIILLDR